MPGNLLRAVGVCVRVALLLGGAALMTGCGFEIAGPGETISIAPLAGEDLSGSCKFDMNLPDQPLLKPGQPPPPR